MPPKRDSAVAIVVVIIGDGEVTSRASQRQRDGFDIVRSWRGDGSVGGMREVAITLCPAERATRTRLSPKPDELPVINQVSWPGWEIGDDIVSLFGQGDFSLVGGGKRWIPEILVLRGTKLLSSTFYNQNYLEAFISAQTVVSSYLELGDSPRFYIRASGSPFLPGGGMTVISILLGFFSSA